MAEIGRWHNHKFVISSKVIRGFTDLNIKASSETEDKESGNQKYVSRKNGKPTEISMTVELQERLGCDVRKETGTFLDEARDGTKDYFYVGKNKLVACMLMLTEASVSDIGMTPKGKWTKATIKLTMKQCGPSGGGAASSDSGDSGNSGGGSGRTYRVRAPQAWNYEKKVYATSVADAISKAGLGKYTGYVHVDDSRYYLKDGVITDPPTTSGDTSSSDSSSTSSTSGENPIANWITNTLNSLLGGGKGASTSKKKESTSTKLVNLKK